MSNGSHDMKNMRNFKRTRRGLAAIIGIGIAAAVAGCGAGQADSSEAVEADATAEEFVARVNQEIIEMSPGMQAAAWVRATYITPDTAVLNSLAKQEYAAWHSRTVQESLRYADREMAPETARALMLLKLGTS